MDQEAADQPEVDVHEALARELHEEVLAGRVGADQDLAVEHRGIGGETPLRAADAHRPAGERGGQLVGEPTEGVTLPVFVRTQ